MKLPEAKSNMQNPEFLLFNQGLVAQLKKTQAWDRKYQKPSQLQQSFLDEAATAQLPSIADWMKKMRGSGVAPKLGAGAKISGKPHREGIKIQNVDQKEKTGVILGPLYGFEEEFAYVIVGQLPTLLRRIMYELQIGHVVNRLLYLDMQSGEMIHNVLGIFTSDLYSPSQKDINLTSQGIHKIGAAIKLTE